MRYASLDKDIRWRMAATFDRFQAAGTLFVPDFLTEEGRDHYPAIFRDAILSNRDDEWLASELLNQGLAGVEAPGRKAGAAARAVSPAVIRALAVGEFNRIYCRAVCEAAVESGKPEVVVYQAETADVTAEECSRHEGRSVNARALGAWLETASLDDFLGLPPDCPRCVFSIRLT
jgi:hypothetical protein